MKNLVTFSLILLVGYGQLWAQNTTTQYKNFKVAVYARAYEVREMADLKKLETITGVLSVSNRVWGREPVEGSVFEIAVIPHSYRAFQSK